ncbi:hypothetical protein RchiOBHm_Chr7g0194261 [Rosa chinensis]|uniref:Uncharacterized protein n=1 Tax=Rosa chinensis TaxID=74649 RepID=A0A2P6P642_ROSCH|nr:hypothetical protein RchiOBHm_Chr7g0194261 [Rosa chinensis]
MMSRSLVGCYGPWSSCLSVLQRHSQILGLTILWSVPDAMGRILSLVLLRSL